MRGSKRSYEGSLKDAFKSMLETYKIDSKFKEAQVVNEWGKIVGKPIADRTSKLFFKDSKLIVELSSAPLKHELNYSKDKIIKLFEERFEPGIIKEIVFL